MDKYALPSKEKLREIAAKQDAQEKKNIEKHRAALRESAEGEQRQDAAEVIQRNYRGYRARRELRGYGLSPSARWTEALKTAQYKQHTDPKAYRQSQQLGTDGGNGLTPAKTKWKRAGAIARHAENDDTSESEGEEGMNEEQVKEHREKKAKKKAEREAYAKTMGLEYFLEMVDHKHRYGSSLRKYHAVWQQSDSKDNFFYWLDHGDGMKVDLEERPRTRLDEERIRYLSREERQMYLIKIGKDGLFRWAKNNELITTSPDFRDSVEGVVPASSRVPTWRESQRGLTVTEEPMPATPRPASSSSDSVSGISVGSNEDASRYVNQTLHDASGPAKLKHVSASALMNNLLRKTTKKNTWIFVADTSFRVYLGIKQSGAFQHSSFLHGGRVSAAGLIRIKHGQLRKLDPLSGHYAPPVSNFRGFVHSLKEEGADLSRVSVSRSYAILLGLEGYIGAKKRVGKSVEKVKDVFVPGRKEKKEKQGFDGSQSAEKERQALQREREAQGEGGLLEKLRLRERSGDEKKDEQSNAQQQVSSGATEGADKTEQPSGIAEEGRDHDLSDSHAFAAHAPGGGTLREQASVGLEDINEKASTGVNTAGPEHSQR